MCRNDLIEPDNTTDENSDDDDNDEEYDDSNTDTNSEADTNSSNSDIFSESENSQNPNADLTCKQIADKLSGSGYSQADLIYIILSSNWSLCKTKPNEKYSEEYEDKFYDYLKDILHGNVGVDYRDGRSYVDVLLRSSTSSTSA